MTGMAMKVCEKCNQEVVKRGWFWVLVSEAESKIVTGCSEGGNHEVDDDEDE